MDKYTRKKQLPEELGIKSFSLSPNEIADDLNRIQGPKNATRIREKQ
jgi:hypothetical protein